MAWWLCCLSLYGRFWLVTSRLAHGFGPWAVAVALGGGPGTAFPDMGDLVALSLEPLWSLCCLLPEAVDLATLSVMVIVVMANLSCSRVCGHAGSGCFALPQYCDLCDLVLVSLAVVMPAISAMNATTLEEFVEEVEWEGKEGTFLEDCLALLRLNDITVFLLHVLMRRMVRASACGRRWLI